ncbi:nucleotidyl transferase AbiEii/AbiGii toxin family protein [Legionella hackeliae]|uniref:Nucleotidyltransferase n=1 Tax=Legionella hackeliae TaxID=449 RepID=A0A0A8UKF3_LEGHA|nr:nucleotidyl transferase AbiEii/AbiGii toxin family protein [Legionella hackeliae]KTD12866.1 hypothetical protein Lhac_1737 [Legionella hackeliae]CEK09173.1 protein of unknown function [Legionella hackeliae]STX49081.1 Uncharacterized protein conserved in bacteria [Legionella hackeliae]
MTSSLENRWSNISANDIELFSLINKITLENDCSYFLIGAKARDILLAYFDRKVDLRKTLDTDIAVCCRNWEEFYKIKAALVNNGDFTVDEKFEPRIISRKYGWLDIVPFGEIKQQSSNLKWPPDYDIEFSLVGFEDTFKHAIEITIRDITIKVASPMGLVLLKLFAWVSRRTQKDASDFAYIIANYFDFGNENRLYEENQDLLNQNFDFTLSGCRLLGRDLKNLSIETSSRLKDFFDNDELKNGLVLSISRAQYNYQEASNMLQMIKQGFLD